MAGDVYVVRISDDPQRFAAGARLFHEDGRRLVVHSARAHRDRFLVRFEGCDTREAAEGLRGALYVPAEELRELDEDEFWEHDLVGAEVQLRDGSRVGSVTGIDPGPGQDRLIVATERGERYVPIVREIVTEVDAERAFVVIDPPAGLLD